MAYYEGKTLLDRMARRKLKLGEILRIAIETAGGLGAAHAAGIILPNPFTSAFRDLEPVPQLEGFRRT